MYNTPILTPEDGVKQPIDTSDGYSGVYKTSANDLTRNSKSDYWIEYGQDEGLTGEWGYIYKGPFLNREEKITTCSKETIQGLRSSIDEFVFRDKGIVQAELRCQKEDVVAERITYSLRNQQEELGLMYMRNYSPNIDYYPFFKLIPSSMGCCQKTIACLTLVSLPIGFFSIIYLISQLSIISVLITTIFGGISIGGFCYFDCRQRREETRSHVWNVMDAKTDKLVAKVYHRKEVEPNRPPCTEIICRRKIRRSQLMGLFSLVILRRYLIRARLPD